MTRSDLLRWGLAAMWGLGIGGFYFYGLWWTLAGLSKSTKPGRWLGISYMVRVSVAMLGFWLVVRNDLICFFITLATFFLMRFILTRTLGPPEGNPEKFIGSEQI